MLFEPIKSVARDFFSLVFMDLCICCYEIEPLENQAFCLSCLAEIPYINKQSSVPSLLIGKKAVPKDIVKFYGLLKYTKSGKVKELLHQLKYCNRPMIGTKLGKQLAKRISLIADKESYVLIPVPLHPQRQKKRGYNQALKIAEGIQQELDIPINTKVLKRIQNNESQTKKGVEEREDKHAIIIDDIITTGSTIAACYQLLKDAGYSKISITTLAITI